MIIIEMKISRMKCLRLLFLFFLPLAFSSADWGFGVYKNEYFNQAIQFITFQGRRSLVEGGSVVATSWHLLQPEYIHINQLLRFIFIIII